MVRPSKIVERKFSKMLLAHLQDLLKDLVKEDAGKKDLRIGAKAYRIAANTLSGDELATLSSFELILSGSNKHGIDFVEEIGGLSDEQQ